LVQVSRELAEEHYAEHKERPFFKGLVDFITSGPVVATVSGVIVQKYFGKQKLIQFCFRCGKDKELWLLDEL
jgi:hypothetical protein